MYSVIVYTDTRLAVMAGDWRGTQTDGERPCICAEIFDDRAAAEAYKTQVAKDENLGD